MRFGALTARIYGLLHGRSPANRVVVDLAALSEGDRALEVGCEPGAALALAADRLGADRVAAVDPSPTFAAMARKTVAGADVREAGAEDLPFDDQAAGVTAALADLGHTDVRTIERPSGRRTIMVIQASRAVDPLT